MKHEHFTTLKCIIVVFILIGLFTMAIYAIYNEPAEPYAARPIAEVRNWNGNVLRIRFPYQDYKYIIDYANPYEYIETDAGYDLVIHFGRFERGEN